MRKSVIEYKVSNENRDHVNFSNFKKVECKSFIQHKLQRRQQASVLILFEASVWKINSELMVDTSKVPFC